MKLFNDYREILRTPGSARTATLVALFAWSLAAIWGWFFVEPTVVRDSQSARDFVTFATKIFPWLDKVRELGPQAEKGWYLHSAYFFALAPIALITTPMAMSRTEVMEKAKKAGWIKLLLITIFYFLFAFAGLIQGMYYHILNVGAFGLHRTGYSFALSSIATPVVAPFFIFGFWSVIAAGLHSAYYTVRILISQK